MEAKLQKALHATVKYWDGPVERWMKHNAPWTDRTTNARNGLFAVARKVSSTIYSIIVGHSVDYGVYLEEGTENMRARPIIRPAIEAFAPKVIASLVKLLDRMG
jgi:HK97 gp10 family phage protein